ncbi:MAG: VOC family protein [Acidimicrobiales bacterium]
MPRLTKLDHASISVADVDGAERFYCDVLGLEKLPRPNFEFPGVWLDGGGTPLHLTTGGVQRSPESPLRANESHIAFTTDDPDGFIAHLAEHGVETWELENSPAAERQIFFFDPWFNMIELAVY